MKIKQLEYLLKVMECGSITGAAQEMNVSQPNLTKSISKLEEEFGIRIMVRKARGVEFTPQGLDFIHYAQGVLAAVRAYPKKDSAPSRKARLFIAAQQLDFIYPALLEAYRKYRDGNIFFNLVETDRNDVVKRILKGQADLGLAVRTNVDSKNMPWVREEHRLDIRVLDKSQPYIAVGPGSPLWKQSSVVMEDTAGHLHIALDLEESAKQGYWFNHGQYENYNNNRIVFVNTTRACEKFLLETDGLAFCSGWTKRSFESSAIRIIPITGSGNYQELLLIRRKGEPMTAEETGLMEIICRNLNSPASAAVFKENALSDEDK